MANEIAALPTPSTYTRLLLQRWPSVTGRLLEGTGLSRESVTTHATISAAQQLQVFRNARALAGRADWALDFGQQLSISSHGPLGFAALSAPTLGEGLDVFGRFARIRAPFVGFITEQTNEHLMLRVDTSIYPLGDMELPICEIVLQVASSYVDAVVGLDAVDVQLWLPVPGSERDRYVSYFKNRCHFDADFAAVVLPEALKLLPCPMHDEQTYRASLIRCREALDAVLSPEDVAVRASHWLAAYFDQLADRPEVCAQPPLEALARAMCMSPRTLIRQLAERGTSFSELRSAQQLEIACKLLLDARYTAGDIGHRLGYGDAANFGRAFRRMTGMSPGQFRRGQ